MGRHCATVGFTDTFLLVGGFAFALKIDLMDNRLGVPVLSQRFQLIGFIDKG